MYVAALSYYIYMVNTEYQPKAIFLQSTKYNSIVFLSFLRNSFFLLSFFISSQSFAQNDSVQQKGIQVSLLTCGTGPEIYSVFGHTAVRIVDSNAGTDIVYNYGTFDGYDDDFELKFMQGKLMYYISEETYEDFISMYQMEGRWVEEQILNTSEKGKRQIQDYLLTNMLPENRAYKYDFFFDNCATRIRDIFTQTHGGAFKYPNVLPDGKNLTFRDIINRYLAKNPWERFGINILLGSKIDQNMSNAQIMFLPDYLQDGIEGATLNGQQFAEQKKRIIDEVKAPQKNDYSLWIVLLTLLLLTTLSAFVPRLQLLGTIMSNFLLFTTGLLGLLILTMWYATDHQTCANNFNLLWALPTNLFFVFRKKQYKYALIAMLLILASLILHVLNLQQLLLPEMIPLLLMLFIIFANIYKTQRSKAKTNG